MTYIRNKGYTQTLVQNKNKNKVNEIKWDTNYDGNIADISLDTNTNGNINHYNLQLDNNDLANILSIPSINKSLDKRLENDFISSSFINRNNNRNRNINDISLYRIELPLITDNIANDITKNDITNDITDTKSIIDSILNVPSQSSQLKETHISSPVSNEELIVPITIDDNNSNNYTFTPKKRHKRMKTHKTYKVYKLNKKHNKSNSKSSQRHSKTKTYSKSFQRHSKTQTQKHSK